MLWMGHAVLGRNPSPGPFSWKISTYRITSRLCLVAGASEMGTLRGQGNVLSHLLSWRLGPQEAGS